MEGYRDRFDYEQLRPGRMYVLHVHREDVRRECMTEESLCEAIDWAQREFPEAGLTVTQLPAMG